MNYAVYEMKTGRISKIVNCPDDIIDHQLDEGESYVEAQSECSDDEHWIDLSEGFSVIKEKINAGIEVYKEGLSATFEGVPVGTWVDVGGDPILVNDGMLEFSVDKGGSYVFWFETPAKYLGQEFFVALGGL